VSEEWRRIAEFQRPISGLRLMVTADAEIEIRSLEVPDIVYRSVRLRANEQFNIGAVHLPLPSSFSVFLRSSDPNCQCQIQAEYIEEVTTLLLDMRYLYGPMGLGIPMPAVRPPPYVDIGRQPLETLDAIRTQEEPKQPKTSPGITRLQAFKRELDETTPEKKKKAR